MADESRACAGARKRRLVVFSDDWGRNASSCQHIVAELLDEFDVHWVHTIGTRRPSLRLADLQRGLGKAREWLHPGQAARLPAGLTVHSPIMWPSFHSGIGRRINRALLARALRRILASGRLPTGVVATAPIIADLVALFPGLTWTYYCVDALDHWPGLDGTTLRDLERKLLPLVDNAIASSATLVERIRCNGLEPELLTHGVDLERWRSAAQARSGRAPARPRALFFGTADERLDLDICYALAAEVDLCFVGFRRELPRRLLTHPGVRFEGPLPFSELPARAADADVLVMPYRDCEATRAMQPLKLKEYLATGLPTVVTPLPAVAEWCDAADVSDDPADFVRIVHERAGKPIQHDQVRARERLRAESWTAKARRFAEVIERARIQPTVLHVRAVSGPGGGPEKTILQSEAHLERLGFRCRTALLHDPNDPSFPALLERAAREGCTVLPVADRGPFDLSVVATLVALCHAERVAIWHGHDYKSNLLGLLVKRHVPLKLVSTAHGWVFRTRRTPVYFALDRFALRRYDRVLAVSQELADRCVRARVPAERVRVVRNAIDLRGMDGLARDASATLRIGGVGRLAPEKRFHDLVAAVATLLEEGHDVRLDVFGEGPERRRLERAIEATSRSERFALRGFEPDRRAIFAQLDVVVSCSEREGLPNALLEAMAARLPIVATRAGGVAEAVDDEAEALLCAPACLSELTAQLRRLVGDSGLRARLASGARARAERDFDFAARMGAVAQVYDELVG